MATVEPRSIHPSHPELAPGAAVGGAVLPAGSTARTDGAGDGTISGPKGWKRRFEDPFNTYYRYPIALVLVRLLVHTPITPNQVSFAQPVLAAIAGYLVTFEDWRRVALAVALFELRSILDCVDGSLARAKRMASPYGHAIDAMADWLGVTFLYVGILMRVRLHPPHDWGGLPLSGAPTSAATTLVIVLASMQAALRSFSFDYFKTKYLSIYESGRDASVEGLRAKVLAVRAKPSVFGHIDVFIGRFGHLVFEREWFDPDTSRAALTPAEIRAVSAQQGSRRAKRLGLLWGISGGDCFLSLVMVTLLADQIWAGQVFFATAGFVWILAMMIYSAHFVRSARRTWTDAPASETA
jgi:phosphatidylglycerophosphate synthase